MAILATWQSIWQYPFMQHALLAGTLIAVMAAVAGYFVVLRGMAFASHTLANIGFAGAAGAVLLGVTPALGLLGLTLLGALGMGLLGKRLVGRDVAVGIILTISLGLGVLFISLYSGYATNAYALLFGDVLGVSAEAVLIALFTCLVALLAIGILYRPLLFASLDQDGAEASGVRVQLLALVFLVVLGLAVAEAVQIVGVLLIVALLITPAATAERLTTRPASTLALAVLLGVLATWGGLLLAFYFPYPLGFFISTLTFGGYVLVRLVEAVRDALSRRQQHTSHDTAAHLIMTPTEEVLS